ncbi:MAG: ABC transporter ATP-binding protein [Candidatus Heimdallarchaeota archaeon]|nr:MAG: ABC transporter ATP-binding protein [Candidatus Heimdallarchaeota archaeon]
MRLDTNKITSYQRWFLYHLAKQKLLVTGVFVGITIVTFSRVLIPVIIGLIIDNALLTSDLANLIGLLSLILVVYLIRNVMDYLTMMVGHYLGLKTEQNMRQEFFDTIQYKPLRYHDQAQTGDLQALATNDLRIINTMISHGAFFIYPFFQVIMTLILLIMTLDIRLALISAPFIVVYVYFLFDYRKKIAPFAAARMVTHSNVAVVLQDSLSGAAIVKSFTAEELERQKFSQTVVDFRDNRIGEKRVQSRFYPLLTIYLAIGCTLLVSCVFVFQNTLTIGVLTATNLILITLIDPTGMIFWATNDMMSGFAACSRLYNNLSMEEDEHHKPELSKWSENFQGSIEFRNVTFAYGNNENTTPVFKNLSFTVEPFQRVAIVGPTGCGKTTLVKLLLRLYEPQEGTILLNGIDIRNYPLEALRRHIGYIEQDIYLFSRTISENIAFGKPNATQEEIRAVAELAQVHEFVREFSEGYNTIVGERGTRLSGGEKQRVAIARAFLTDPEILILDDSVSAVDSETEEKISRALDNVVQDRTTLIITHRLHAIRTSDRIIVLKHGKIVAEGNHNELLHSSEDYRRIFGKHLVLPELTVKKS